MNALMESLTRNYAALPTEVREEYLQARIDELQEQIERLKSERLCLATELNKIGRWHADQIIAADSDTQTIVRLRGQIDRDTQIIARQRAWARRWKNVAWEYRITADRCAKEIHMLRSGELRDNQTMESYEEEIAELERSRDAQRNRIAQLEASQSVVAPTPEAEVLRCEYCGATTTKNGRKFEDRFGVTMHQVYCTANPNRTTRGKRAEAPAETVKPARFTCVCGRPHASETAWRQHAYGPGESACKASYEAFLGERRAAVKAARAAEWDKTKHVMQEAA